MGKNKHTGSSFDEFVESEGLVLNPKAAIRTKKSKQIKFHLEKPVVVRIDRELKRIYSITN